MQRSNRSGFTLIEVMAAAVILAFVVVWLTGAVGQMNRTEGDARRRAQAALYADRLLVELEQATGSGAPLQLGKRELDDGMFQATIEVAALDPALLSVALGSGDRESAAPRGPADASGLGWLSAPSAQTAPPVVQATVRVTGKDGSFERGVTRTSFFLNPAALDALAKADASGEEAPE